MDRELDQDAREPLQVRTAKRGTVERPSPSREVPEGSLPSREHDLFRERGSVYRLSESELTAMYDLGRFRTVALEDLARYLYHGRTAVMRADLKALVAQGLVQTRAVSNGPRTRALHVAVLTNIGKAVLERHGSAPKDQALYARLVKRHEVRHDAAIYRMFQSERQKIEQAGGRLLRIILDYELKRRVYAPLAKAKRLSPPEYAQRQQEVAGQHGLAVIGGKIPLPDLRIEYETATGELARVDLELATGHYHGPALAAKAQAGFKFYAADGSGGRLTRVLEERDITVAILSL